MTQAPSVGPRPARDPLASTRVTAGSLAAIVLVAIVFIVWPGLDLAVASWFALGKGHFVGQGGLGDALRHVFYVVPFLVLAALLVLHLARRRGWAVPWAPGRAGLLVAALSLALGPGLLVNVILKDHSHRPRPYQVTEFGGDEVFRPFYRTDGECRRNCSFVSGEGASAFWTLAPALLVPLPWRAVAVAAALIFGSATGLLRMAFGGHFLSDTLFAALFTWLVILASWRLVGAVTGRSPAEPAD